MSHTLRVAGQQSNQIFLGKILQFKLVLLGEAAVGKSSLVLRFVKGHFQVKNYSLLHQVVITHFCLGLSRIDNWSSVFDSDRLLRRYHCEI